VCVHGQYKYRNRREIFSYVTLSFFSSTRRPKHLKFSRHPGPWGTSTPFYTSRVAGANPAAHTLYFLLDGCPRVSSSLYHEFRQLPERARRWTGPAIGAGTDRGANSTVDRAVVEKAYQLARLAGSSADRRSDDERGEPVCAPLLGP
jgi:hypothetical protein